MILLLLMVVVLLVALRSVLLRFNRDDLGLIPKFEACVQWLMVILRERQMLLVNLISITRLL